MSAFTAMSGTSTHVARRVSRYSQPAQQSDSANQKEKEGKTRTRRTPGDRPDRPDQIHDLRLHARRIARDAEPGVHARGCGRRQPDAREEAVFREDGDGVEEEDGDCV